jgi:hypothetical protein
MQTFLPYPSFQETAEVLDRQRLHNQRNEALIIAKTLMGKYPPTRRGGPGGWPWHPATKMWTGHVYSLCEYGQVVCVESRKTMTRLETVFAQFEALKAELEDTGPPPWLGREDVHRSHRSNLLAKDPTYYRQHWPDEPAGLPYVWPRRTT